MPKVYKHRPAKAAGGRIESAADGAKELHSHFGDWTSGLSKFGIQAIFGLMAANWAIHGSRSAILSNSYATASIVTAIAYLAIYLVLAAVMVRLCLLQVRYCEDDQSRWEVDFKKSLDDPIAKRTWPYTRGIENTGQAIQYLHTIGPLLCGLFLLVSVWFGQGFGPASEPPKSATGQCCSNVAPDIRAIRDRIDEYAKSSYRDRTASTPDGSTAVPPGRPVQGGTPLAIVGAGLLLVLGGLAALVVGWPSRPVRAVGAALATAGLTMSAGGLTLFKDVKLSVNIEDLIKIVREESRREIKNQQQVVGNSAFERVASIEGFKIGNASRLELKNTPPVDVADAPALKEAATTWIRNRAAGRNGVFLLIGSADRLPLSRSLANRYDANSGLAQARANAVRDALTETILKQNPQFRPRVGDFVVIGAGPSETPEAQASTGAEGFPADRRVEIWAFWTTPQK